MTSPACPPGSFCSESMSDHDVTGYKAITLQDISSGAICQNVLSYVIPARTSTHLHELLFRKKLHQIQSVSQQVGWQNAELYLSTLLEDPRVVFSRHAWTCWQTWNQGPLFSPDDAFNTDGNSMSGRSDSEQLSCIKASYQQVPNGTDSKNKMYKTSCYPTFRPTDSPLNLMNKTKKKIAELGKSNSEHYQKVVNVKPANEMEKLQHPQAQPESLSVLQQLLSQYAGEYEVSDSSSEAYGGISSPEQETSDKDCKSYNTTSATSDKENSHNGTATLFAPDVSSSDNVEKKQKESSASENAVKTCWITATDVCENNRAESGVRPAEDEQSTCTNTENLEMDFPKHFEKPNCDSKQVDWMSTVGDAMMTSIQSMNKRKMAYQQ